MKAFKILISLLFITATVFVSSSGIPAKQAPVSPRNLLTLQTVTSLGFIDGYARVNVDYTGYDENAEIRVDVLIEKQVLYFFKKEIFSESYFSNGDRYQNEFFYPVEKDGSYNCTVVYTITGKGGEDVITFADTKNYKLSDYPEHTHVWNQGHIEPTCANEGRDITICRCGKTEIVVLEKLPHTPGELKLIASGTDFDYFAKNCTSCGAQISSYAQSSDTNNSSNGESYNLLESISSKQQCNCPSCMMQRSFAKIEAAKPKTPKQPSMPTDEPWYMPYTNKTPGTYPNHNNQQKNTIRIFP